MRVYLNEATKFTVEPPRVGYHNRHIMAFGQIVSDVEFAPYITVNGAELPFIPELSPELVAVTKKITWCVDLPKMRTIGEYRWGKSYGVVSMERYNTKELVLRPMITIELSDPKRLFDAYELFSLISSGKLHPTVPHNGETSPSPIRNIQQLLREIAGVIHRGVITWWYKKTRR